MAVIRILGELLISIIGRALLTASCNKIVWLQVFSVNFSVFGYAVNRLFSGVMYYIIDTGLLSS